MSRGKKQMIVNVRVDHRLLHGQVAMAWNQTLGSDCILIANDDVPNDEIRKTGIKLAKPHNTKLVIKNMDDSVKALTSGVTDKYRLFIVVETIADVYKLAKESGLIKSITLGGVKSRENTIQIAKAVFVTSQESSMLKELITDGIEIEIRQVPNDTKIMVHDALK
jgi:fructoselysine and glucoselysine-specific PTS system IIB component